MNYYNEFDPKIAAWLRQLIADGHIPAGEVDERSIEDVKPGDLRGFVQCHFFAGIGGWSHALDLAGWPRNQRVWTGSCPCQPFSAAGKGDGFADERHLWPAWQHLINQCRPPIIFGEQVASKAADMWIDLVHADMENMGYAFGCIPFPSAGVGAPHIRDRNYWVAYSEREGLEGLGRSLKLNGEKGWEVKTGHGSEGGDIDRMADSEHHGYNRPFRPEAIANCDESNERLSDGDCSAGGMADRDRERCREEGFRSVQERETKRAECDRHLIGLADSEIMRRAGSDVPENGRLPAIGAADIGSDGKRPGPVNGFWRDADWLLCTDGKWRPVESANERMADGVPEDLGFIRLESYPDRPYEERLGFFPLIKKGKNRSMRLKGYGNAINPHQAAEFICATVEAVA